MPAWPLPSVGSWGWSSATFAPHLVMDLCCRPWGSIFVVLSCFIWYITMHFCTDLFFWSFLSQARAQLVQADNLQFGSLGAARGDDAERRWWTTMGEGGGCWPKAWAGSAADIKVVISILPCLFGGCCCQACLAVVAGSSAGFCSLRMSKKPVGKPETSVRWFYFAPLPIFFFPLLGLVLRRLLWDYLRGKVGKQDCSGVANGCTQGKWCWTQGAGVPCPCCSPWL